MAKKASPRGKTGKAKKPATTGSKEKSLLRDLEAKGNMVKGGLGSSKRQGYV